MESDPYPAVVLNFVNITVKSFGPEEIAGILIIIFLLVLSALISGSEVAFFSLSPSEIKKLKANKNYVFSRASGLLEKPERLLANILIFNNFVNIGIVIISTWLTGRMFDFAGSPVWGFVFQGIIITLVILFFGEILPKAYATQFRMQVVSFMAIPIWAISRVFSPISYLLVKSSRLVNHRIQNPDNISMSELSHAIDLASSDLQEEEKILKGIVKFGNIDVKNILKPRVDVVSLDMSNTFNKVTSVIVESGYSRIPVISGSFDNIKGILYIKDLLPHLHKTDFRWQSLIRPPYFIPETKKINDLLEEFQTKKIHMAIVIDEYGGTSGIVTLEDVLEEIVGDISDEFDPADLDYYKLNENEYVFEGKTLLNDFYRIMEVDDSIFNEIKGDADTLAGLVLEMKGAIPNKNDVIQAGPFEFKIKAVDNRRIKQLFVSLKK